MTAAPRAAVVSDGAPCRNCGSPAPGADCAACGQETRGRLPTLREFGREAAGRYVALDPKQRMQQLTAGVQRYAPYAMFALVPAFALLMLYLPLVIAMIGVLIMAAVVIG